MMKWIVIDNVIFELQKHFVVESDVFNYNDNWVVENIVEKWGFPPSAIIARKIIHWNGWGLVVKCQNIMTNDI